MSKCRYRWSSTRRRLCTDTGRGNTLAVLHEGRYIWTRIAARQMLLHDRNMHTEAFTRTRTHTDTHACTWAGIHVDESGCQLAGNNVDAYGVDPIFKIGTALYNSDLDNVDSTVSFYNCSLLPTSPSFNIPDPNIAVCFWQHFASRRQSSACIGFQNIQLHCLGYFSYPMRSRRQWGSSMKQLLRAAAASTCSCT